MAQRVPYAAPPPAPAQTSRPPAPAARPDLLLELASPGGEELARWEDDGGAFLPPPDPRPAPRALAAELTVWAWETCPLRLRPAAAHV